MVQWISHRGESIDAPENTAAAFRLAMDRDTDGMETDIHLTSDGVLVCCHDSDTKRTCGGSSNRRLSENWKRSTPPTAKQSIAANGFPRSQSRSAFSSRENCIMWKSRKTIPASFPP